MERFKLNIDVKDSALVTQASVAAMEEIARNPMQKIGYVGLVPIRIGSVEFVLIRNEDSYTVREK